VEGVVWNLNWESCLDCELMYVGGSLDGKENCKI